MSAPRLAPVFVAASAVLALAAACGDSFERACRTGADCASGVCSAQGTCLPVAGAAGGAVPRLDAAAQSDAPASFDGAGPGPDPDGGCAANRDDVITREEIPLLAGLRATYRFAQNAAVAPAGTVRGDGTRVWDLTAPLPGDHLVLVDTRPATGTWFASKYAGATYVARLADASELLGVFEASPGALLLRGVVSPADGLQRTELTNAPAAPTLQFPLSVGKPWQVTVNVTGLAQGVLANYTEKYDAQVDAAGEVVTPYGTFRALRVRTILTRTVGIVVTTIRVYAFVAECFGTVARITSKDNEPNPDFSTAAEVMRLSP